MNSLAFFNPRFTSDLFDVIDRNLSSMAPISAASSRITPQVDVRETPDAYVLDMDLPGVTENDVEINLKERILTISSVKDEKKEEEKTGDWLIRERKTMSFSRSFSLPQDIDEQNVSAEFDKGVLTINIPRKPEPKPLQISIKAKQAS